MTATSHADRTRPLSAHTVKIAFGPDLRKDLAVLAGVLKNKSDFDPSVHQMVESMSTGTPTDLTLAMTQLAMAVRETAEYAAVKKASDVKDALDSVIGSMVPGNLLSEPVQITVEPPIRAR